MTRFSVGGDEDDENGERSYNSRHLPKRTQTSDPPSASNSPDPAAFAKRRRRIAATIAALRAASEASISISAAADAAPPRVDRELDADAQIDRRAIAARVHAAILASYSVPASEAVGGEEVQNRGDEDGEEAVAVAVASPIGDDVGRGESGSSSGAVVTLTDTDVLDCPICYDALCPPVYQCENGHIACASCCTKIRNKCANCCLPIGYNRCRAIEKVIESVRVTCRNAPRGCMETLNYSKKLAHEKICNYAPCSCPHIGCAYIGMSKSLYAHFSTIHPQSREQFNFNSSFIISLGNNQKHVFLQERSQNVLFVLNRAIESFGSFVSVVCVAPTTEKKLYLYDIMATVGESSIKLAKTYTECTPKWSEPTSPKIFLTVPRGFVGATGQVFVTLTIYEGTS